MRLSRDQRRRLRNGDLTALDFPFDQTHPDHGRPPACCVVLEWEPERRLWDSGSGQVVTVPRQPLLWIEVTQVNRHRKGHWRAQFSVTDLRHKPVYLGVGGTYTTSRWRAIDPLEVVPKRFQDQEAKRAFERDHAVRLERVGATKQKRSRFRRDRQRAGRSFLSAA